jgi:hypothetical protein
MKTPKDYSEWINPVYRDVVLILFTAILSSAAIVTVGYMVVTQMSGKF